MATDASEKDARRVALQFERIRALLGGEFGWARLDPSRPVTILAVRDEKGMKALAPERWEQRGAEHLAGLFMATPCRNWVLVRLDLVEAIRDVGFRENPYRTVFHEYVHLVLHQNFKVLPVWLDEGLADFWGNTMIRDGRVDIGVPIPEHLLVLRSHTMLSVKQLLAVTRRSPEYTRHGAAGIFYAEAWALVHDLAFTKPAGRLNRFATALGQGKPAAVAAEECLGTPEALERELTEYVRRSAFYYHPRQLRLDVDEKAFTSRPLPVAESLTVRAAFHAANRRPVEAQALAGQALALDPQL
ncbi:MAG TPA: DUF1570 domain-containing protein, partial [Vicinamibacteria bacterium]|nr:DUF1570 domain-containing protein [Vicinamibacteria bacterium]